MAKQAVSLSSVVTVADPNLRTWMLQMEKQVRESKEAIARLERAIRSIRAKEG